MTEYIITMLDPREQEYYLAHLAGCNFERAVRLLQEMQEERPNRQFRIEGNPQEQCWWNDPYLVH